MYAAAGQAWAAPGSTLLTQGGTRVARQPEGPVDERDADQRRSAVAAPRGPHFAHFEGGGGVGRHKRGLAAGVCGHKLQMGGGGEGWKRGAAGWGAAEEQRGGRGGVGPLQKQRLARGGERLRCRGVGGAAAPLEGSWALQLATARPLPSVLVLAPPWWWRWRRGLCPCQTRRCSQHPCEVIGVEDKGRGGERHGGGVAGALRVDGNGGGGHALCGRATLQPCGTHTTTTTRWQYLPGVPAGSRVCVHHSAPPALAGCSHC